MRKFKDKRLENRIEWITKRCENKDVLDVGCVGGGEFYHNRSDWLHGAIKKRAKYLLGIDANQGEVDRLQQLGYNVKCANGETFFSNSRKFDVVVAGEFIEHIDNPGLFLDCAKKNLRHNGYLILTTPNARHPANWLRFHDEPEHVQLYSPSLLSHLLDRHGFKIEAVQYFKHKEGRLSPFKLYEEFIVPVVPIFARWFSVIASVKKGTRE